MKNLTLQSSGRLVKALAERINGVIWVHMDNRTFTIPAKKRFKAGGAETGTEKNIVAPMPGKLIKILLRVGDNVEVNQTVAVIEAMKMEYQLKAVKKSKVKSISGDVGDQIQLGQIIVELEPVELEATTKNSTELKPNELKPGEINSPGLKPLGPKTNGSKS